MTTNYSKHSNTISLQEKKYCTAIISIEGIGPRTFFDIEKYLKLNRIKWEEFWVNHNHVWSKMSLSKKIVKSINIFKKEYNIKSYWQMLKRKNISVISDRSNCYPFLLKKVDDHPPILFVKGDINLCVNLPIAIIGTRRMTAYGKLVTSKITQELVGYGATIISGFMYGVDVRSQQVALESGGATVGILGYGFDHIFPHPHRELMKKMLKTGQAVFISEYPPFVQPTRGTFPRRNRIIAGLSLGVVVTEAGPKSGTQITVGYALDYGRDVFAVSGPITSPYHEGVKQMLNQGAMLVGSGQEVIGNLSANNWIKMNNVESDIVNQHQLDLTTISTTPLQNDILNALKILPLTIEELSEQLEQPLAKIVKTLTELELRGLVKCQANQWLLQSNGI